MEHICKKKLDDQDSIVMNDVQLYAASLIKPYVLASLYEQIWQGKVQETQSMADLSRYMITFSDNDSCNLLVLSQTGTNSFSAGVDVINSYLKRNGYTKTEIHHSVMPSYISYNGTKSNYTSVKDCGKLLEAVYYGNCVNKACSQKMLDLLLQQQRRWKIPAGLPAGTKVANKTGETDTSDHDMAIVYGPKCTYILCVMSENSYFASGKIAEISGVVYDYFNGNSR